MRQQTVSRYELVQELRQSLRSGEVSMRYQPIVDLTTSEVLGFESLMRWQHPTREQVPPNVFISLAEKTDLIYELGSFALHEADTEATSWERTSAQAGRLFVTVNLSARQFHDPDLLSVIQGALEGSGLAPERLVLGITESVALLDAVETKSAIERLDHYGVTVALDDFGTGCSSLSYLALFRPMIIKIDGSFVNPPQASIFNDRLLEAVISLSHKLEMAVYAEEIETQRHLARLRHLGCEVGQGYLFSPAVSAGHEVAAMFDQAPRKWAQRLALSTRTPRRHTEELTR
ncbi:MAG: EAL domain-containing protein [Acidimicrobiales bacterium]